MTIGIDDDPVLAAVRARAAAAAQADALAWAALIQSCRARLVELNAAMPDLPDGWTGLDATLARVLLGLQRRAIATHADELERAAWAALAASRV